MGWSSARSPLAITDVQPARAIASPARLLIPAPGSETARASLPVGLVCTAADDADAALARSHLRALAIDHLERVRQRSAARTNGHRLRLLVRSLFRFGFRCLVGHGCVQPTPNLFILETARLWVKRVASNPFYFSLVIPGEPLRGQGGRLWFCNIPAIKQLATPGLQSKNLSCRYSWSI